MRRHSRRCAARAFTLVELLVVFVIIAILIAIVLPALGAARNAVRKAESRTVMQDFQNAYGQFRLSNDGRDPGLFDQSQLGSDDNGTAGLSVMENALLDLLGSDAVIGRVDTVDNDTAQYPGFDSTNPNIVIVGTSTSDITQQYYVNTALLGAGDGYFAPNPKHLVAQTNEGAPGTIQQYSSDVGDGTPLSFANTGEEGVAQMPDLVDAFGTPILLWVPDQYGTSQVDTSDMNDALDDFILDNTNAGNAGATSLFYPNANKAFLAADTLGRKQTDMTTPIADSAPTSIIGFKADTFADDQRESFMALFGNPAFPQATSGQTIIDSINAMQVVPAGARGDFIIQSAGPDGIYFSNRDPGFRSKGAAAGKLEFWQNFGAVGQSVITEDMIEKFDDVLVNSN
ncbi:MAG: hypothetical protein DHS20C14_14640 [Phycisphaeraceae bacterium]|nr:MAG: hypothetical protein DHS20C14_14640 [Phycisphaeraceae bacterium]